MSFKQVGEKIFITEVPKGYDAQKIYRHLNKHMDNDFLKDYIDSSVDNVINIELIFKRGQTPGLSEVEKVMGVSSSIVPNYTLITEKGVKVFHTVEEILEVFTVQRLAITKRRYELLIKDYEDRLTKNNEIIRFIREKHYAIAEKKANRKDYIDYLTKQKFTYAEYLADMAIYRMTKEEVEKRQLLIKEETTALNDFRKVLKSSEQIKKKLIEELEDTGKKLTAIMNEKEAEKKRNFHKAKTTQPKTKQ